MKTLATDPVRVATSIKISQPRLVQYYMTAKKSLLRRFQDFIETTNWDEKYISHQVIDKICLGVIILSIIYFCFRPGAYLTEIFFRNYGQWIADLL